MIQITQLILILHKDKPSKYEMPFWSFEIMIYFIKGKKLSKPVWPYVKK